MKNSWLYKLLGAFLFIIVVGGSVIAVLTARATQSAFNIYTTRSGQSWAQRIAPSLAEYYETSQTWDGVVTYIQTILGDLSLPSSNQGSMGQMHGQGPKGLNGTGSMMGTIDQRVLLTDSKGFVLYDSTNQITSQKLPEAEQKEGTPIIVNDITVGTLLLTPENSANTPAAEFLQSVRKAIISSAIVASFIALVLGTLLFVQLTAPMRKLRKAAAAVAEGNLEQRVDIPGQDEFAELGVTFNQMMESLSQAQKQREHLMADVAHELRTPLSAIQGTLEAIQDGVLPYDREQIDALYAETTLLNRLIGDLRLLSLAENSQLNLELQQTSPSVLVQQVVERAQPLALTKNIRLEFSAEQKLSELLLDPDRITQVLNNLIQNSLRYSPSGGSIMVDASEDLLAKKVIISVTDTGPGIRSEDLPNIFDRFYRADKSRSRNSGGSGLGLAIVKELVHAHGGRVSAISPVILEENQKGSGTKFIIELPLP